MIEKKSKLTPLPEELRPLLEEVVRKRNPEFAAFVLAGEFGRLNATRGYDVERLIDWVGARIRWAESQASEQKI